MLYGVGFGPVVPGIPAGQVVQQNNSLAAPLEVQFETATAVVNYYGLAPGVVGLYQFNVVVPNVPSSDSVLVTFRVNGVAGSQALYLPVQGIAAGEARLSGISLSASSVAGGTSVTGTVALSGPAPVGGAVVALSSSSSAVSVPATVTVPAGATTATFTILTPSVSANQNAMITAVYGGATSQVALTVTAANTLTVITIGPGTCTNGTQTGSCGLTVSVGSTTAGALSASFVPQSPAQAVGSPVMVVAKFGSVSATGQTYTLNGLQSGSYMATLLGASYPMAAGSVSITLTPTGSNTSGQAIGTVTGTYSLTSSLTTITGTISGSYFAVTFR